METTSTRRRSQRLFVQLPVIIEWQLAGKPPSTENTFTNVVNAHGALIEMRTPLQSGQNVTMRNQRTNETAECAVKIVTPADRGKFNVALEFTTPNPGFWRVSFPPEDWTVRHPDAKR